MEHHNKVIAYPEEKIIDPALNYESINQKITQAVLGPAVKGWGQGLAISVALLCLLLVSLGWLFYRGIGIWGNNNPVGWAFDIINFVWWVGIAHAGTFISAILLLCKQKWRMSISRFSEAMTLFSVACAGMFPVIHLGRPDRMYWLFPLPNTMWLWPQFRSPLMWDVFAVSTYASVSVVFWYTGLIPDLGAMRDRATELWKKRLYGFFALGWRGSARHWFRYETACTLLAGLEHLEILFLHVTNVFEFDAEGLNAVRFGGEQVAQNIVGAVAGFAEGRADNAVNRGVAGVFGGAVRGGNGSWRRGRALRKVSARKRMLKAAGQEEAE